MVVTEIRIRTINYSRKLVHDLKQFQQLLLNCELALLKSSATFNKLIVGFSV